MKKQSNQDKQAKPTVDYTMIDFVKCFKDNLLESAKVEVARLRTAA